MKPEHYANLCGYCVFVCVFLQDLCTIQSIKSLSVDLEALTASITMEDDDSSPSSSSNRLVRSCLSVCPNGSVYKRIVVPKFGAKLGAKYLRYFSQG